MKKKRTFKLVIEYDGTNYSGWQSQNNSITIQQKIEEVLEQLFQQKITLYGSGRTDAGVHAVSQVASFSIDDGGNRGIIKRGEGLGRERVRLALNSLLPGDIVIKGIREMPPGFHARHNAKGKRYRYVVLNRPYASALCKRLCWFLSYPLDVSRMRRAARALVGRHSFRAFSSESFKEKSYVRNLKRLTISKDGPWFTFVFEADGFLYNMIRNIVGTLIEVGRGRMEPGDVRAILKSEKRVLAGPKAPPQGLYLEKVFY